MNYKDILNINYKNLLYIDIETTSKYKDIDDFKNNDERGYNLFLRKIERKKEKNIDWNNENINEIYISKSPLIPEYGKILCITMGRIHNNELKLKSIYNDDEKEILKEVHYILKNISNNPNIIGMCGFYIKEFDIPWINKKLLKYDLNVPRIIKTFQIKPWESKIYDLSTIWSSNSRIEKTSFDEMLYELGIDSPKDVISGKDVYNIYWEKNNLIQIKEYCEKDVIACNNSMKKIYNLI
jgi:uncharacterized protein YprB with RNaseH-like and TPR domain